MTSSITSSISSIQFYPAVPASTRSTSWRGGAGPPVRALDQRAREFFNGSADLGRARAGSFFQAASACRPRDILGKRYTLLSLFFSPPSSPPPNSPSAFPAVRPPPPLPGSPRYLPKMAARASPIRNTAKYRPNGSIQHRHDCHRHRQHHEHHRHHR